VIKKIELQGVENARRIIGEMIASGRNIKPLQVEINGILHDEVEENFQAGGRDPKWPESQRVKKHGGQTLIDSAQLVNSIQEFVSNNSSGLQTNKEHAAIHNFGGEIKRQPYSGSVRLRTDAKGNLLRQGSGLKANLAVFARSSHKRATERSYTSSGYTIRMPQREFMKISPAGVGKIETAATAFLTGSRK
jgi:phage gpG-like protein